MITSIPHLRVARLSSDPDRVARFYVEVLGFEVLARFSDHEGFDGIIVGHDGWPWHLEFTRESDRTYSVASDVDQLLVLYLPDEDEWSRVVSAVQRAGHPRVPAQNPYWDVWGATFEDPDGFRLVFARRAWPGAPRQTAP